MPFYWIEALRVGVSPDWVPFQAMGYPLYMNAQSGYYYPGFWLFVLLDNSYSYASAMVFQGLHILLGAVGAGMVVRAAGARWSTSLLAAVAYQAFGGFYGNASHPDIVRAHALVPWVMLPVLARWNWRPALQIAVLLLPFWVYCLWTGAYAGAAVAVVTTAGVLTLVRMAIAPRSERRIGAYVLLGLAVGTALSAVFLLPLALDRDEVARVSAGHSFAVDYLTWRDLMGLVLRVTTPWFGHDVTMRSSSLALPVVALAIMRLCCRRPTEAMFSLLLVVWALAMASGILLEPLARLVTPLAYSRFPISDYRSLIALGLVLLATQAWECLPTESCGRRYAAGGLALVTCAGTTVLAWFQVYVADANTMGAPVLMVVFATLTVSLLFVWLWSGQGPANMSDGKAVKRGPSLLWVLLVLLVVLDWFRVHGNVGYLFGPPATSVAQLQLGQSLPDARARLRAALVGPSGCRPAREFIPQADYLRTPWRGYYTGDYLSHDYAGPMQFTRHSQVLSNPSLLAFGLLPWRAVDPGPAANPADLLSAVPSTSITCVYQGTVETRLQVDLLRPTRIVENEIFWPGWTAQVAGVTLQAVSVHGMRAWDLPQGRYELVGRFDPPHRRASFAVAFVGLMAWLLLLINLRKTT